MELSSLWRRLRFIPLKYLLKRGPTADVHGFRLADATVNHAHWEAFVELTRNALEFIQAADPRRYAWLPRTIGTIAHGPMVGRMAAYLDPERICLVDIEAFMDDELSSDAQAILLASVLVHEATHGRLFQLGIPYNKRTRVRVEQRCHREQLRFLKRGMEWATGEPYGEDLEALAPFSLSSCEKAWNTTFLQHFRGTYART